MNGKHSLIEIAYASWILRSESHRPSLPARLENDPLGFCPSGWGKAKSYPRVENNGGCLSRREIRRLVAFIQDAFEILHLP